jgi:LysM domain
MALVAAAALALPNDAQAFPHVVKKGETLAQIAEKLYGKIELEQLLVAANGLEATPGAAPILPGMRLEVPAVSHRRVVAGETWNGLAEELLGDPIRSDVLAIANGSMPWMMPADGLEIVVPYNLRYTVVSGDSLLTIAYRFLGERDKAWTLDRYNHLREKPVHRNDVVLVPLVDLPLTPAGRTEAADAGALVRAESGGRTREAQIHAETELPLLAADVRNGRWAEAIARGNRLAGSGELARPQVAAIHRNLVEAYAALDATGLAEDACRAWREADPEAALDPIALSPKILTACTRAPAPHREPPPGADAGAPDAAAVSPSGRVAPTGRPRHKGGR